MNDPQLADPAVTAVIDLGSISLKDVIELNSLARFTVGNLFVIPEPVVGLWSAVLALGCLRRETASQDSRWLALVIG